MIASALYEYFFFKRERRGEARDSVYKHTLTEPNPSLTKFKGKRRSKDGGEGRVRTFEGIRQQIYSLSPLAAWVPLHTMKKLELVMGLEPATL